ncbi:MAG: serine/threonine protein kinase [Candidatus Riflebacteria bacterium]|nr:serine/threonine protein kinase [Candidatus Riflebacteria bacterium]
MSLSAKHRHELDAGTVLGGYRVESRLTEGGMGIVYRATQLSLGRPVALKVLSPDLAFDSAARQRFLQEGLLAARVSHPHLVRVLQVGESAHRMFLAYELVTGGTLRQRLRRDGAMPLAQAIEVAVACADVLGALHQTGILHRDIKPENIFLSDERGPMVGDLGIAKDLFGGAGPRTRKGFILGTPLYLAPELIRGKPASPASDLYALGVVFFECLAGRPPFESAEPTELLKLHLTAPPPSVLSKRHGLPPDFDRVLARILAKEPRQRFEQASDLLAALRQLPTQESSERRPAAGAPGTGPRPAVVDEVAPAERGSGQAPTRSGAAATQGNRTALLANRAFMAGFAVAALAGVAVLGMLLNARRPGPNVGVARRGPSRTAPGPSPTKQATPVVDRAALARSALQESRLEFQAARAAEVEGFRRHSLNPLTLSPAAVLEHVFVLLKKTQTAAEKALNAQAPLVTAGDQTAARASGDSLMDFFLFADHLRVRSWDNMTAHSHITNASWSLLGSLSLEFSSATFMERVSRDATRFLARVPACYSACREPGWKVGWLAVRSLARYEMSKEELDRLHRDVVQGSRELAPLVRLTGRPTERELRMASTMLRLLIFMGASRACEVLTDGWLEPLGKLDASRELAPAQELLIFEIAQARARLTLRTNLSEADHLDKQQRQLETWTRLRDRLITHWPYDPRDGKPSSTSGLPADALALHDELTWRLDQARSLLAVAARRQEMKPAREPAPATGRH